MSGNFNDKLHDISRYTKRNAKTPHCNIFDVVKPNDAWKIACPLNIPGSTTYFYLFSFYKHVRMEINIILFFALLNNARSIVQMLCS